MSSRHFNLDLARRREEIAMSASRIRAFSVCAFAVLVLSGFAALPAPAGGPGKKGKAAERANHYLRQLHARFNDWDLNGDNTLDKTELARAFRGKQAKPYDRLARQVTVSPPVTPTTSAPVRASQIRFTSVLLTSLPESAMPVQLAAVQLLTDNPARPMPVLPQAVPPQKVTVGPTLASVPDYQLVLLADKNGDGKLSKAEYDGWAKQYAHQLARHDELESDVKQAEARLRKATTAKGRQQAQLDLQRHAQALVQVQSQLNLVSPAMRQTLKLKH
jgi:EF hand